MSDLISRQVAIETLGEIRAEYNLWNEKERHYYEALSEAIRVLNAQNDKRHYAKIVRCKDCKYWNPNGIGICKLHDIRPTPIIMDDWFCADGERRDPCS